jgi:hypothetical protein
LSQLIESTFGLPWWTSLLALAITLLAFVELGFRLARSSAARPSGGDVAAQASVVLGGLLAMLGLLLAFSFGIVEARYAARKALVLDEANAIGTTYLRAGLLPSQHADKLRQLLREYAELRLRPSTPAALDQAIERSGRIHTEMWREAENIGKAHPESEVASLFVSSLNELIDLHTSRLSTSLHQRLPSPIFNVLFVVAMIAMLVLGYAGGLAKGRAPLPVAALILSLSSVFVLIYQMDSPSSPLFRINQWALEDVRRTLQAP